MEKKYVVLVVEDNPVHQEYVMQTLAPVAEVLMAGSLREGMAFLRDRADITHAILDGRVPCFPGEALRNGDTTHQIAYEIAEFHEYITMHSFSGDETINTELEEIGCIKSNKATAPQMVLDDILSRKK